MEPNIWIEFGRWVSDTRRDKRMKQAEVAAAAGIERPHLSAIENGKTGVKRETAIRLASALGVDVRESLTRAGFSSTQQPLMVLENNITGESKEFYPSDLQDAGGWPALLQIVKQLAEQNQKLMENDEELKKQNREIKEQLNRIAEEK